MKVHQSIQAYSQSVSHSILTIGTFDGVHIGHQKIIEKLNSSKSSLDGESTILTFFPHPRQVLQSASSLKMINTLEEKIQMLDTFGLDHLIIEPFTNAFAEIPAHKFIRDVLMEQLHINKLIIGYDHRFGKNREGNFEQLQSYQHVYGYELEEINAQEIANVSVSSTKIRQALEAGEIEKANSYLGYHYLLTGNIVAGQGIGRTINFPTINLAIQEDYKLIPKSGVYIVSTKIENNTVFGIMNIGMRPTLNGKHQTIEIHLLDFTGNLYGEKLQISLLKRLRNEVKFDSLEALTNQIRQDEAHARTWLQTNFKS